MKRISQLLLLTVLHTSIALGMDDYYQQFKDAQQTDSGYEDVYTYLSTDKKLSEKEILELADAAPKLMSLALQDCAYGHKLAEETLQKMLVYVNKISRSPKEREQLAHLLKKQTSQCTSIEVIILEAKAVEAEQFKEFVLKKQSAK